MAAFIKQYENIIENYYNEFFDFTLIKKLVHSYFSEIFPNSIVNFDKILN